MIIARDTREREGHAWSFGELDVIDMKLESGDYSIVGLENKLCIERKKSVSEIAINIGSDSARFNRELERMKSVPLSYIICEFSIDDVLCFPKGSSIPREKLKYVRIGGKYILKTLGSYFDKYGITVIYAGNKDNAIEKAIELMNYALEIYGDTNG